MSTIAIDPAEIGQLRWAPEIRRGWHVGRAGELALDDPIVGTGYVTVNVQCDRGSIEGRQWPVCDRVWTRNVEEQVRYIEAMHRRLVADQDAHSAVLSARKPRPCARPECLAAAAEVARLRTIIDSLSAAARARKANGASA